MSRPASRSQSRLFRILDAKGSSEAYADITQGQATRKNDEKEACFLWTPTMPRVTSESRLRIHARGDQRHSQLGLHLDSFPASSRKPSAPSRLFIVISAIA